MTPVYSASDKTESPAWLFTPRAEHLREQLSPAGVGLVKRNYIGFI